MAEPHRTEPHRSRPISRHPLFPAIVALWFGALLALGSLALRTSLVENLVLATRIDSLVPAAAPPLGLTARLLLALALGLAGGAIGWVLARRMAAPKQAFAPQVFAFGDTDLRADEQWPGVAAPPTEPTPVLDPASLLVPEDDAAPAPAVAEPEPVLPPVERPSRPLAEERITTSDLAALSHVELVERLAIALRGRRERLATTLAERPAAVVRFPDFAERRSPPPAPRETEKALREALATLQRMSGG